MRALSFAAVVFLTSPFSGLGQDQQFPYEAVIQTDGIYVRSGPGEKYYSTGRLAKGQRVRVHRHDPGGWFMIAPPEGSFSWIPASYVRVTGTGTGEVLEDGVVAYVGTEFGSEASVFQRRLSAGQQVEIIGEGEVRVAAARAPEKMYKIRPPRREWRWIPGQAIVPLDSSGDRPREQPPLVQQGDTVIRQQPEPGAFLSERPGRSRRPRSAVRRDVPAARRTTQVDPRRLAADRERLAELDDQFRTIISRPTAQWDFQGLEAAYRQLKEQAALPVIARQVDLRFPALRRYQRKKAQYDEFVSLTSSTAQRDQELARMSSGVTGPMAPPAGQLLPVPPGRPAVSAPVTTPLRNGPTSAPGAATDGPRLPGATSSSVPLPSGLPEPSAQGSSPLAEPRAPVSSIPPSTAEITFPDEPVPPGMIRVPQKHPRFAGAGIIERSGEPDVPPWVLLDPTGKILAYLDGVGNVDLSQHVGYAMGLQGARFHSEKLKADYIRVRGLVPVRLRGQ